MPPPDQPLKDIFSDLEARAKAGDKGAATRLYRDLNRCSRFRGMERGYMRSTDATMKQSVESMDPDQLHDYETQLDAISGNQRALQAMHTVCDGAGDAMLDDLVPSLQRAAELGDTDARACYLDRGPNYDARSSVRHPEMFQSYRDSAPAMIESGIAAGDWKTVDLLRSAYEPGAQSVLAGVLGNDPYQYYRYLKLYRLGAEPYRAEQLDQQLATAAESLTPEQRGQADTWAQTASQNFEGSSTESTVEGWDACSLPYE